MFFKDILGKQYASSGSLTKPSKTTWTPNTQGRQKTPFVQMQETGENPGKQYLYTTQKCNLKEIVTNSSNSRETPTHYVVDCPLCYEHLGEEHQKLYIAKDFSFGFCQRCKSKFISDSIPIETLLMNKQQLLEEAKSTPFVLESLEPVALDIYNGARRYYSYGFNYLSKRNPALACKTSGIFNWYKNKEEHLYESLGFRFVEGKIVMPFFFNGNVFYYQTRSTDVRSSRSYFSPPIKNKPIWISPLNRKTKDVIITEGIFGAIAAQIMYNTDVVSIQGSHASLYQIKMLKECGYNTHSLYLDNSTINANVAEKLREFSSSYFRDIKFIESPHGDPEDDFLGNSVEH